MFDVAAFAILLSASVSLILLSVAVYRLVASVRETATGLEMSAQLAADLKVFSISTMCYLKTVYDKQQNGEPTNPSQRVILLAEQLTTAALVTAGVNARAYNLRTILEAIHVLYSRERKL
jgi:hypothetical protein